MSSRIVTRSSAKRPGEQPRLATGIDRRRETEGRAPPQIAPVDDQQRDLTAGAIEGRHWERRLDGTSAINSQLTTFEQTSDVGGPIIPRLQGGDPVPQRRMM